MLEAYSRALAKHVQPAISEYAKAATHARTYLLILTDLLARPCVLIHLLACALTHSLAHRLALFLTCVTLSLTDLPTDLPAVLPTDLPTDLPADLL